MRKLADSIGYSVGTIYLHFKDKQDLLHEVVEESFAQLLLALRQVPEGDPEIEVTRRKLRVYVDFGLSNPGHYRFVFMMPAPTGDRAPGAVPHEAFEVLREAVRECIESGAFRASDVETTSQALWAVIHGITSLLIARPDFPWVDRDTLIDKVIDTALEGLRSPAGATP